MRCSLTASGPPLAMQPPAALADLPPSLHRCQHQWGIFGASAGEAKLPDPPGLHEQADSWRFKQRVKTGLLISPRPHPAPGPVPKAWGGKVRHGDQVLTMQQPAGQGEMWNCHTWEMATAPSPGRRVALGRGATPPRVKDLQSHTESQQRGWGPQDLGHSANAYREGAAGWVVQPHGAPKKSLRTAPQRLLTNQPLPTAEEESGEHRRSLAAAH